MFSLVFGKVSESIRTITADIRELTSAIAELNNELTKTKGLVQFFEQFGINFTQLFK